MKLCPRIVHLSDMHFSSGKLQWDIVDYHVVLIQHNTTERAEDIRSFLSSHKAALNAPIIVDTGDITDSGDESDFIEASAFLSQLRTAGYTVLNVPGNHDYFANGNNSEALSLLENSTREKEGGPTRKQNFEQYILGGPRSYPYCHHLNGDAETGTIVLLDSLAGISGQNTYARGRLGSSQIDALKAFVDDPATQARRRRGARLLVALHHSPYDTSETGKLEDADALLTAIEGKVDALLFGHTTPPGVHSQGPLDLVAENGGKIALVSCMNLQWADTPGQVPVNIIDIERARFERHWTDGSGPTVHDAQAIIWPRQEPTVAPAPPVISGTCRIGAPHFVSNTAAYYDVVAMAVSRNLRLPTTYEWELDGSPAVVGPVDIDGLTLPIRDFQAHVRNGPGPFRYEHEIRVRARDATRTVECMVPAHLPTPDLWFETDSFTIRQTRGEPKCVPTGIQIGRAGLGIEFALLFEVATVRAVCSGMFGALAHRWTPPPKQGQGTDTATYKVLLTGSIGSPVSCRVTDAIGQSVTGTTVLAGLRTKRAIAIVPKLAIPRMVHVRIPWDRPEFVPFQGRVNPVAKLGDLRVITGGELLNGTGFVQFGESAPVKLLKLTSVDTRTARERAPVLKEAGSRSAHHP